MKPKPGDKVRIKTDKGTYEGRLMPSREGYVLKLDTGYNIGFSNKAEIELVERYPAPEKEKLETGEGEIVIIGMGGTISSKVDYNTGGVHPHLSPKDLLKLFPELSSFPSIKTIPLFSVLSEDMNYKFWQEAAEVIHKEIKNGAKGIIILHGTDTMSYSSAALSFMLRQTPVPVVFVGAQRSSDRPSSDSRLNLMNAVFTSTNNIANVGVVMHATTNDDYSFFHLGTRVRKMHTSSRDAFKSIGVSPLAMVDYRRKMFEQLSPARERDMKRKTLFDKRFNPNVAMIYIHPGIKPELIDSLSSYDGVVLVGTGLGHAPTNPDKHPSANSILENLNQLTSSGIPVVMSSQTIEGRLNLNVYSAGRLLSEAGVIGSMMDWTPETAFIKLSWILGHEKRIDNVKEEMLTSLEGEITRRSAIL